jgi:lipopolysaccharide transport system ATP-binding protein
MSDTVISVENVSKIYRLGEVGTGSLAHDVNRWWHRIRGKEDPYLKVGQVNDRTQSNNKSAARKRLHDDWVYALKDISFDIKRGEVLGIIGRNGAGKSTLLKILSRVTSQTSGKIKIKGRIASLLEVGTGFHPELTAKENIFLNGTILGMRKAEIKKRFDEIIEFSGCSRYVDTPVKRFSSGMYVRLAFAVAAHLDPEILIVDEVLAVGDIEFQKKCMGKMKSVSENGKTVLFVSHNLTLLSSLCTKGLLLNNGTVEKHGSSESVISAYIQNSTNTNEFNGFNGIHRDQYANIFRTYVRQGENHGSHFGSHLEINAGIEIELLTEIPGLIVQVRLFADDDRRLILSNFDDSSTSEPTAYRKGRYVFEVALPANLLARGTYRVAFWVGIHNRHPIVNAFGDCRFSVENTNGIGRWYVAGGDHENVIRPKFGWNVIKK